MRLVWAAMTARIAVDDRASKECLRHQGYASAIQKVSKPTSSQAFAIMTVSGTGSMLSWRTPMLNGIGISSVLVLSSQFSVRLSPGVLQALDQLPYRFVQRCRNTGLLSPFHNRAVHEIHFGLAFGEDV